MKYLDLTGDRYGKLTVIRPSEAIVYGTAKQMAWLCLCDCGNTTIVPSRRLRSQNRASQQNGYNVDRCESCRSPNRAVQQGRPWSEILPQAAASGLSLGEVAKAHGVDKRTVSEAETRYGIKLAREPSGRSLDDWRKIFQDAEKKKMTVADIAVSLNVTPNHVYIVRRRLNDQS